MRSQTLINQAFPEDTETVHIQFTYGEILITPVSNRKATAIKQFKKSNNECFLACSSGVDALSMVKKGFKIETLLEYRPNEKRDKNDMNKKVGALKKAPDAIYVDSSKSNVNKIKQKIIKIIKPRKYMIITLNSLMKQRIFLILNHGLKMNLNY